VSATGKLKPPPDRNHAAVRIKLCQRGVAKISNPHVPIEADPNGFGKIHASACKTVGTRQDAAIGRQLRNAAADRAGQDALLIANPHMASGIDRQTERFLQSTPRESASRGQSNARWAQFSHGIVVVGDPDISRRIDCQGRGFTSATAREIQ
jgi:hypothetical protein